MDELWAKTDVTAVAQPHEYEYTQNSICYKYGCELNGAICKYEYFILNSTYIMFLKCPEYECKSMRARTSTSNYERI